MWIHAIKRYSHGHQRRQSAELRLEALDLIRVTCPIGKSVKWTIDSLFVEKFFSHTTYKVTSRVNLPIWVGNWVISFSWNVLDNKLVHTSQ